jgi:hypothetical protein
VQTGRVALTVLLAYRRLSQNGHPIVSFCLSDLNTDVISYGESPHQTRLVNVL